MLARSILSVTLIAAVLTGCGPTTEGMKNREAANDRMNLISAQIHFDQAKQAFETGQFDKAMREVNNAIARYDKSGDYYVLQGRIFLETHRLEQALESLKTAQEKKENFAEPHYFAGIVYQRWSDDEQAHQNYLKAFEYEPTKVQYLLAAAETLIALGEFDAAEQLIGPKLDYFEHNAALRQLQGQIALLRGDAKLAADLYAQARLLNPEDDMLLEELMWAQWAAQQYGPCHATVKALQDGAEPKRTDLIHLEARCLTLMNRGPEARERYLELTRLKPEDPLVWSELGTLAWDLGDYRRVALCSVQVISMAPDRYEGYMLKGINERQAGNLDEAAGLFREAAKRAPELALPSLLLGQTLEQSGKFADAAAAYNDAIQAEPGSTEARMLLRRLNEGQRITAAPTGE